MSLLFTSTKLARAQQLKRQTCRIFKFDSVTGSQWTAFTDKADDLCNVLPSTFSSWHINQMCKYLQSRILNAAKATLLFSIVGNNYTFKVPKELKTLIQHYQFLNRLMHSIHLLRKYPLTYSAAHEHKKGISDSSIRSHVDDRNNNFETDLFSFIESALFRTRRHITLDCIFLNHPTRPQLLTDPKDIDDAVINHFQSFVPIKSSPLSSIDALPDRWSSAYQPMDDVSSSIYDSLMNPLPLKNGCRQFLPLLMIKHLVPP
ncbi:hypothetical protein GLOIN_2v1770668 [Rhizophagus irregularis DAOM 181602=DAOM 197198]|nr:hypothetical protein GLOIN_2v1770668 [Rhizophagus irregularis DAOM 181602=DAOM 197198]